MDDEPLSATLVALAGTMVAGFDSTDFMCMLTDRTARLLNVAAAGLLADPRGGLRVAAASSEAAREVALFQIQRDQGPSLDCFRFGRPVCAENLTTETQRWPRFAAAAQQVGFAAVQALPMRLREQIVGTLSLFRADQGVFAAADVRVGQALADVAALGLFHERRMRRSETRNEQLQAALSSRIIIEQAKGKLAERLGLNVDQAFNLLRDIARNRNLRLADLAQAFVDDAALSGLTASRSRQRPLARASSRDPRLSRT